MTAVRSVQSVKSVDSPAIANAAGGTCRNCWRLENRPYPDHTRPDWRRDDVTTKGCHGPLPDLDAWHYCIHFTRFDSVPQARRTA